MFGRELFEQGTEVPVWNCEARVMTGDQVPVWNCKARLRGLKPDVKG